MQPYNLRSRPVNTHCESAPGAELDCIPPTFVIDDHSGCLKVWQGVLADDVHVQSLREGIHWKRHVSMGYCDRQYWRQAQGERQPQVLKELEHKVRCVVGDSLLVGENYANLYEGGENHTFFHRDTNANPGESVTLVSAGGERKLAFIDFETEEIIVLPLTNGSVVQFDALFNAKHGHKVLKEDAADPRVSVQWYRPRDEVSWSRPENRGVKRQWERFGRKSKDYGRAKRKVFKLEPWDPDKALSSSKRAQDLVPEALKGIRVKQGKLN